MTNSTKKMLLSSVLSLVLCMVMLIGTTFAWFTDSVTSSGNKIQAGTLKLDLELLDQKTNTWKSIKENQDPIFNYDLWEPGYTDVKILKIENEGNLALKWYASFVCKDKLSILADVIDVYVCPSEKELSYPTERDELDYLYAGTLAEFIDGIQKTTYGNLAPKTSAYLGIALKMQESANNDYQGLNIASAFDICIYATQYTEESDSFDKTYDENAEYLVPNSADEWDGTNDTHWYFDNPDAETFFLDSSEDLAGLASLLDGTAIKPTDASVDGTLPVTFEGKTIKLEKDVDLGKLDENGERVCFNPIGSYRNEQAFKGTFDGQGHTISNMHQNTWALDNGYYYSDLGLGLFGCVEDATIKNLNIDNATISGESGMCGTVAATSFGKCTYENITVTNSEVADYQYYSGGIVGWAANEQTFINCDVDASTTIAAQWGDFDNSIGGIIGGCSGSAQIYLKDCDVACRIDAFNDVTSSYQWYAYRRCGMLIGNTGKTTSESGRTIAAPQLTAENCTVTYGAWANYHYCEFAGTSWPYVRVEAGVSNSAYSNPRYGHPTDANGNQVIDENHTHNAGEDHNTLCAFDQLYGGGQGVYGNPTHAGVTVIYNNK